jgi:hypothetical protein
MPRARSGGSPRHSAGRSPLASWLPGDRALARLLRAMGRRAVLLPARDRDWRGVVPGFEAVVRMAAAGLPFQIAADRRYDRSGDPRRLGRALARGDTVFLPQAHQVLPRLARLMVALRAACLGPGRPEASFLFAVEGRGREGMGLHHDGEVDAVWLQIEGRRTVTVGPPVPRGTPEDLPEGWRRRGGRGAPRGTSPWWERDLEPGSLLYLPPRAPHRVVCRGRSLAVSLTWGRRRPGLGAAARRQALARWDVVSGRVDRIPAASRRWLFTQVPAAPGPLDRRRGIPLPLPGGAGLWLPAGSRPWAAQLAGMPRFPRPRSLAAREALGPLIELGLLAPRDLPQRIIPADPGRLDGWRFR